MKTRLQWVSKGYMLSLSLVPRLWPFPPRTMGDCKRLSLSSAIIMIIILSRGLIQLARANKEQGTCQSKPLLITAAYWRGCVKTAPCYLLSFDSQAWSAHPLLGQSVGLNDLNYLTKVLSAAWSWGRTVLLARVSTWWHHSRNCLLTAIFCSISVWFR